MNTLRKLSGLVALSALVLVTLLLSANGASAQQQQDGPSFNPSYYYFGFDTTVKPWVPAFNGNTKQPGLDLVRSPEGNGCAPPHEGRGYANLTMFTIMPTGNAADTAGADSPVRMGTWMIATFPASGASLVTVDYAALATKGCDGCLAMTYIGTTPPATKDFAYENAPLATKWQDFEYQKGVLATDTVYVAIGFGNANASVGFDCINIKIEQLPRPALDSGSGGDAAGNAK